jgi:hypothetical protein
MVNFTNVNTVQENPTLRKANLKLRDVRLLDLIFSQHNLRKHAYFALK